MSVLPSSAFSRLLLASVSVASLASPLAAAAPSESETIIVIGEKEAETGYKVTDSVSAMRTNTPLVDTPQSITVVTAKQIEDQAANSIGDAVRYTPGIYSAQGEGNRETLVIRGMTTTGDFFVDGIRDDVQTYRDLYNIQRLEVFRGSNAMTFGRGGTGGLINRVTKVAGWDDVREVRLEGGMYQHYRGQFDLGGAVSEAVALRVTGVYQNSESYRDGVNYERWGINPTASFRVGPDTLVQVGYEHFKDERIADRGVPSQFRPATTIGPVGPLATPRGQFFGDAEGSPTSTNTDAGNLYISHDFSDTVSIRNRTRYADYDKFYQNVFTSGLNTGALNNTGAATGAPGLPTGSYAAGTIAGIQAYNQATRRKNLVNQTDLNAEFATGGIKHTLLIGAEFAKQKTGNIRLEGLFPQTVATSAGGTTTSNVVTTYVRPASPRIRRPDIVWQPLASSGDNYGTLAVSAGYVQDQIELTPQFEIVLGVRYEHLVTKVRDRRTVGFPATQRRDFKTTDNLWSPRAGLIYKPVENASLYASFSRSYLPRGGDQLAGLNLTNETLNPERYENYELGAKWDINPNFNVSAAIYQLDRDNVIVLIDPNNPGAGTELGGGQRSKGFELGASGKLTPQFSVVGAYTYQDAEFTKAISATVRAGAEIPNAPRHSASLWGRYDVTSDIGLALGAIYQGRRYAAQDNLVRLPGFTRFDAALFYKITENVDVQVNIENLFDKRYFQFAHSNTNITPGSPTSVRGAINVKF
ncbi:TonB-dependent receptor [Sphingomonas montanisoli]|uniref:TonB-dependent receptor n=1 Tax=Sphingomonas montanisoli TaxID=2606412 RepID=UPI001FE4B74D|nr:TonB-dependent siderophore receptor [Sphingomonas montanisoli]